MTNEQQDTAKFAAMGVAVGAAQGSPIWGALRYAAVHISALDAARDEERKMLEERLAMEAVGR